MNAKDLNPVIRKALVDSDWDSLWKITSLLASKSIAKMGGTADSEELTTVTSDVMMALVRLRESYVEGRPSARTGKLYNIDRLAGWILMSAWSKYVMYRKTEKRQTKASFDSSVSWDSWADGFDWDASSGMSVGVSS